MFLHTLRSDSAFPLLGARHASIVCIRGPLKAVSWKTSGPTEVPIVWEIDRVLFRFPKTLYCSTTPNALVVASTVSRETNTASMHYFRGLDIS